MQKCAGIYARLLYWTLNSERPARPAQPARYNIIVSYPDPTLPTPRGDLSLGTRLIVLSLACAICRGWGLARLGQGPPALPDHARTRARAHPLSRAISKSGSASILVTKAPWRHVPKINWGVITFILHVITCSISMAIFNPWDPRYKPI